MADGVKIDIVSPERMVLSETADSVTVPGTDGYFTVSGEHAPMMSTLRPGYVTVNGAGSAGQNFFVAGGFADVAGDGVTILAEDARPAEEFGASEIEAKIAEAKEEFDSADEADARTQKQAKLDQWRNLLIEAKAQ